MFGTICGTVATMIKAAKARQEWLGSLPPEEAAKIRAQDELEYQENLKHRRALEIAEASRPRNFWGK
jgi:hypothetical protein